MPASVPPRSPCFCPVCRSIFLPPQACHMHSPPSAPRPSSEDARSSRAAGGRAPRGGACHAPRAVMAPSARARPRRRRPPVARRSPAASHRPPMLDLTCRRRSRPWRGERSAPARTWCARPISTRLGRRAFAARVVHFAESPRGCSFATPRYLPQCRRLHIRFVAAGPPVVAHGRSLGRGRHRG